MILISCASGNIGSALALRLKQCGAATRLAGRTAISDDPATVRLDFLDHSSFAPAVAGCDAVFLLRPPAISAMKTTLNAFIDVARRSGVGHIVFVSVAGADRNAWVPHHAVERYLQTGPKDWTILRPGFFSQNLIDAYRRDIVEDNRLYVPAAGAHVAFIDARDVADVAATALLNPGGNRGKAISLPGSESLTFEVVADLLTEALGRPIRYAPASVLGYMAHLGKRRLPIMQIFVQTLLHVNLRQGRAEPPDTTLAALLIETRAACASSFATTVTFYREPFSQRNRHNFLGRYQESYG